MYPRANTNSDGFRNKKQVENDCDACGLGMVLPMAMTSFTATCEPL